MPAAVVPPKPPPTKSNPPGFPKDPGDSTAGTILGPNAFMKLRCTSASKLLPGAPGPAPSRSARLSPARIKGAGLLPARRTARPAPAAPTGCATSRPTVGDARGVPRARPSNTASPRSPAEPARPRLGGARRRRRVGGAACITRAAQTSKGGRCSVKRRSPKTFPTAGTLPSPPTPPTDTSFLLVHAMAFEYFFVCASQCMQCGGDEGMMGGALKDNTHDGRSFEGQHAGHTAAAPARRPSRPSPSPSAKCRASCSLRDVGCANAVPQCRQGNRFTLLWLRSWA
jgi:hypothetical protein